MKIPGTSQAEEILREGGALNPGPWIEHSLNVARAARFIAAACPGIDPDAAYSLACLHDIGRRFGITGMRHVIDGYDYLIALGYPDAARICLTHSYPLKNARAIFGAIDVSADDLARVENMLAGLEYDDYDRLIQLCDALAMATGFVLIEKRLVDVVLRYGCNEYLIPKWQAILKLKHYFDERTGGSVYRLLPGIVENTFGFSQG